MYTNYMIHTKEDTTKMPDHQSQKKEPGPTTPEHVGGVEITTDHASVQHMANHAYTVAS